MNDEELAALWEKLVDGGLSEDEADEHVRRAMMGEEPEKETTALQAGAMHAFDNITGYSSDPDPMAKDVMGGLRPNALKERQAIAKERQATLENASDEHPYASLVGEFAPLLSPGAAKGIASGGLKLARGAAKGLAGGGGRLLDVAKALMSEAPIVGRRGMVGRPVRAGVKAWQKGGAKAPVEVPTPKRGAYEEPPQGSFPPIEGTGGGESTFGMSAGEARAANAPSAYAREHAGLLAQAKKLAESGEDALTVGARNRVQPSRPFIATNPIEKQIAKAAGKKASPRGLQSNKARQLSAELNKLLKQHMAK